MSARAALAAIALVLLLGIVLLLPFAPDLLRSAGRVWEREHPPAGFPLTAVDSAARLVASQVAAHVYPGAALAAGVGDRIQLLRGIGRLEWETSSSAVSPESTRYDLASLSKAVATTTAVLLLAQDGRIRLDDPVRRWLPEFYGRWKDQVTWRHLLTHTSGLPPGGRMSGTQPGDRLAALLRTRLDSPPGTEVQYSDVGYIVLWAAAQRVAGEPLPRFLRERVWRPLAMSATGYLPGEGCQDCAPTLTLHDGRPFRGEPADPTARELGGIAGNAGLFSTASDLARFAAMVASGGELDGVRIFRPDAVRQLFTQQPRAGRRTLGWDAFCPAEPPRAQVPCQHPVAFGHYGWTGTSLWIDPRTRTWVVLLANRSYEVLKPRSMEPVRVGVFAALSGERLPQPQATPAASRQATPAATSSAPATPSRSTRLAASATRTHLAAAHRHRPRAVVAAAHRRRPRAVPVRGKGKRPGKRKGRVLARG